MVPCALRVVVMLREEDHNGRGGAKKYTCGDNYLRAVEEKRAAQEKKKPDRGARRKNTREAFVYITREKFSTAVKIFRIDEVCKTLGAA